MRCLDNSIAPLFLMILASGCNTVAADECWPNTSGGFGGSGTIPIGEGVGATSGDFLGPPPPGPLDYGGDANPCIKKQSVEQESPGGSKSGEQEALLQQEVDNPSAGGLLCSSPLNCVDKCVAEQKYCFAGYAAHPYKPGLIGELFQCIDAFPKASAGGSFTCLYRFPNGDACIFAHGSKLGPFTLPAPPPLCLYKTP